MEPGRNPCVLPSNAPVLGRLESSKRVFQVTSGNLQLSPVDKVEALTKVSYDGQVTSRGSPPSTELLPVEEILNHRRRKPLRGEGVLPILTQVELNSPKYLAYRARQRRDTGKDGEPVWPDHLEEAFQKGVPQWYGIYCLPRLIINSFTGDPSHWTQKENARRQRLWEKRTDCSLYQAVDGQRPDSEASIKSHTSAQGLHEGERSMYVRLPSTAFDDRSHCSGMKLVTADEASNQLDTQTQNEYYDSTVGQLVTADSSARLGRDYDGLGVHQDSYSNGLPPPAGTLGSNAPVHEPSIQRIIFEMWVHPPASEDSQRRLHNYTSSQSDISASSMILEDLRHWRTTYPHLSSLHQEGQLNGTELILLEANFELMNAFPPRRSKLGIHLDVDLAHTRGYSNFRYSSNFYQTGTPDPMHSCGDLLRYTHMHRDDTVRLEIPLESRWWVMLFHKITERRFAEKATGDPQAIQADEEQTRQYLREMSIMQEVFATPDGDSSPQRVAILLWKFRQTRPGETATTTWRKLHAPPSRIMTNSPAPPLLQPPMAIDSTIHDNITPQATPLYAEFFSQQDELIVDANMPSSTSPSQNMQYPSFDSSLPSTSLPSTYSSIPHDSTYGSTTASVAHFSQTSTATDTSADDFTGGQIQIQYHEPPPPYDDPQLAYPPPPASQASLQRQQYDANTQWAAAYHASMFAGVEFQHTGFENLGVMAREESAQGQVMGDVGELEGQAELGFQ